MGGRVVVALALVSAACGRDTIDVREVDRSEPQDYGHSQLLLARGELAKQPDSPAAYAKLAAAVERLRPRMTKDVEREAELALMVDARGPMERYFDASPAGQMDALGVTVWPTLFKAPARAGETPETYLERVCNAELVLVCRKYVPEALAPVMVRYAWDQVSSRLRNTLAGCAVCTDDPTYTDLLAHYRERADEAYRRAFALRHGNARTDWPVAGAHASPWTSPLWFVKHDEVTLDGAPVAGGQWRDALAAARGDRTVLGLYVGPGEKVEVVRAIADDAAAAGFTELALAARAPVYPWKLQEYRLSIGRRARGYPVRVRSVESVQVLVQAVDATIEAHGTPVKLMPK